MARPEDDPVETAREAAVMNHRITKAKTGGENIKSASGKENAVVDILSHDESFQSSADRDREGDPQFWTERDRGVNHPLHDRSVQRHIDQDGESDRSYAMNRDYEDDPQYWTCQDRDDDTQYSTDRDYEVNPPSHYGSLRFLSIKIEKEIKGFLRIKIPKVTRSTGSVKIVRSIRFHTTDRFKILSIKIENIAKVNHRARLVKIAK